MDDKIEECEFYIVGLCSGVFKNRQSCFCNKNPNCYYKQNLALKEENDELKELYNNIIKQIICDIPFNGIKSNGQSPLEYIKSLKENLKVAVEALKSINKDGCEVGCKKETDCCTCKMILAEEALTQIGEIK